MPEVRHIMAVLFILLIAYGGWKVKSLTISGAIGAFIVGFLVYLGFSFQGLLLLGSFFASSSLLSKFQRSKKLSLEDMLVKGDRRDIIQVLANGGVPALLGLLQYTDKIFSEQTLLLGFCISIAAANADTWASEIGTLSKQKPRLLLTLKKVERGTSGAVSILGTCAAIAGASFISIFAWFMFSLSLHLTVLIIAFGFLGNLIDTLLGQTFQLKYKCKVCGKITEKQYHCETSGIKQTKFSFLNNDAVNFLSIILSSLLAFILLSHINGQ
ncbi:hypothetical protein WQ54_30950 [Bacillus sp. SA1-12]|uniref:DUF92 domain-containing protein n=1 Tax=Bacillus sp. SA1-12 TaxID=1455638 RepID=UPI000626FE3F|nr:DUF92 domain-containing protein [Bacillus sp. SA1-12]KKI88614.1 hypothetical protein WQ54_30950 [Bacillus sp. SA1-12]